MTNEPTYMNPLKPEPHHRETFAQKMERIKRQTREWKPSNDPYKNVRERKHNV
jgi:hypothetical protein